MSAVDFKILSVTFANTTLYFIYLFLGTIMNIRKRLYLSCLLLLSSTKATFAMDNAIAGPSRQAKVYTQLGTEAVAKTQERLERAYFQSILMAAEHKLVTEDVARNVAMVNLVNRLLSQAADELEVQRLLTQKIDTMNDTIELVNLLRQEDLLRQTKDEFANTHVHESVGYNATDAVNAIANESVLNQSPVEPQEVNPIQRMDQEVQTEISAIQDQNKARQLRMSHLLAFTKKHPYATAGTALAVTAGGAYLLRKPLTQLGIRAKNSAANIYSNFKSRFTCDNSKATQASENKFAELVQTAVLRLIASMSDEQLKRPGVAVLLEMAWRGHTVVLRNEYFNSLLRSEQKELLSALLLMHKDRKLV
jgi:hypothetical protein